MTVDINCDMGESFGNFIVGNDETIMPFITSANIACGFHGGDPWHMQKTIQLAKDHKVKIGAHPSYPDLGGFGRRKMDIPKDELKAIVKYQIAAMKGMAESLGAKMDYVKPHGALYNAAATDEKDAMAVIEAIKEVDASIYLMGLAGSHLKELAEQNNIKFIAEAFADRKYTSEGKLMSRKIKGSVINSEKEAVNQMISIMLRNTVKTEDGEELEIVADSICIHGDNKNAVKILTAMNDKLTTMGIGKKSFVK